MRSLLRNIYFTYLLIRNDYIGGRPKFIKNAVLKRFAIADACWVETGTYKGETTRFLARFSPMVHSIEPDQALFDAASQALAGRSNIKLHHGKSEEVMPKLIPTIQEDCNFWLDGHYSGKDTFHGEIVYPILQELQAIRDLITRGHRVAIFVDDIYFLNSITCSYKVDCDVQSIVEWVHEIGYAWTIENDMMIIKSA